MAVMFPTQHVSSAVQKYVYVLSCLSCIPATTPDDSAILYKLHVCQHRRRWYPHLGYSISVYSSSLSNEK